MRPIVVGQRRDAEANQARRAVYTARANRPRLMNPIALIAGAFAFM
jgi:hypothetical protein